VTVRTFGKWVGRGLLAAGLVWTATFVALLVYTGTASPTDPEPTDAIVCLGAGMSRTAGLQSPDQASLRRAVTCARLYADGIAPTIIFTGYGHEVSSAAAAMGRIASEMGVPDSAIVLEEEARSTIQNAAFSLPLLPDGTERILVVSDLFHLPRSGVIFRSLTHLQVSTYPADTGIDGSHLGGRTTLRWTAREALAIWSNLARGAAYLVSGWAGVDADTRIGWFN
jgi:uncharacterized SAM-binding protein YcdF (DUF218 family)